MASDYAVAVFGADLARTVHQEAPGIRLRITNARTEVSNRVIKQLKRVGCGYRNKPTTNAVSSCTSPPIARRDGDQRGRLTLELVSASFVHGVPLLNDQELRLHGEIVAYGTLIEEPAAGMHGPYRRRRTMSAAIQQQHVSVKWVGCCRN